MTDVNNNVTTGLGPRNQVFDAGTTSGYQPRRPMPPAEDEDEEDYLEPQDRTLPSPVAGKSLLNYLENEVEPK